MPPQQPTLTLHRRRPFDRDKGCTSDTSSIQQTFLNITFDIHITFDIVFVRGDYDGRQFSSFVGASSPLADAGSSAVLGVGAGAGGGESEAALEEATGTSSATLDEAVSLTGTSATGTCGLSANKVSQIPQHVSMFKININNMMVIQVLRCDRTWEECLAWGS
jgi:hypothetical protein